MASYLPIASTGARSRPSSPRFPVDAYETESLSSDDAAPNKHSTYGVPTHYRSTHHHHHHHHIFAHATTSSSNLTSAYQTPTHSRSNSPSPRLSGTGYFYSDEEQPYNPLLGRSQSQGSPRLPTHRKWFSDSITNPAARRPSRRRSSGPRHHGCRRVLSVIVQSPFFPAQPATILLSVTIVLIVCLSITLFLMYLLNPDKAPLPWRSYCALEPPFPAEELASLPPVGIFLGVMSTDTAVERRMLIRSTWAQHVRSRGSDGSTDRTVVRFILGIPQADWTRRIQLEAESYKDMILLPVPENMNNGKTHAYIDWAHHNALVPPPSAVHPHSHRHANLTQSFTTYLSPYPDGTSPFTTPSQREHFPSFAANHHAPPPALAPHDPQPHHEPSDSNEPPTQHDWVRPQFVIKADDDAFVMLTELEARLRLEWYAAIKEKTSPASSGADEYNGVVDGAGRVSTKSPMRLGGGATTQVLKERPMTSTITPYWPEKEYYDVPRSIDPMIYWGYLVKTRFMAGELYALSSSLVDYIATTPNVRAMTRGAEDKLTARWLRMHPRPSEVRWRSEHCWIYDHPRAGTVYSHGFLFPSEVARIRHDTTLGLTPGGLHLLPSHTSASNSKSSNSYSANVINAADTDPALTHSTVSRFGKHYRAPARNLTTEQEVEALVEGSAMSRLRDETVGGASGEATPREVESAWRRRESRHMRTLGVSSAATGEEEEDIGAVGGTVVVHFIKRNEWFLETALAFLEDEPAPPPLENPDDTDEWADSPIIGGGSRPGSGGNRVETDLSGKTPLDLSNLDPQPEADVDDEEPVAAPPKSSKQKAKPKAKPKKPEAVQAAPKKGPSRIETDFGHKQGIDISHLDDVDLPVDAETGVELPTTDVMDEEEEPTTPPTTDDPASPPADDEAIEPIPDDSDVEVEPEEDPEDDDASPALPTVPEEPPLIISTLETDTGVQADYLLADAEDVVATPATPSNTPPAHPHPHVPQLPPAEDDDTESAEPLNEADEEER